MDLRHFRYFVGSAALAGAPVTSELAAIFRRSEGAPAVRNLIRQLVAEAAPC